MLQLCINHDGISLNPSLCNAPPAAAICYRLSLIGRDHPSSALIGSNSPALVSDWGTPIASEAHIPRRLRGQTHSTGTGKSQASILLKRKYHCFQQKTLEAASSNLAKYYSSSTRIFSYSAKQISTGCF